jgi:hypothetical protein
MLIALAEGLELFHTPNGTAYADLFIDRHRETWPVRSARVRGWLRRRYYDATGEAASAAALGSALNLLEARAQFDGLERLVNVRVAEHAGRIYVDLADPAWRAIEIAPDGWQVMAEPPVRFRRPPGMSPLPVPQPGGSLEELTSFLNLPGRDDLVLATAWLLAALRPSGPYPLLVVAGEQGSAKTVLSKLLRTLIDPNVAPVRTLPREERDVFIAANNGHVLAFDNLSALPPWLSDTLCRLASGGAFAVRQLYTDQDEVLLTAARPIILNGIEDVVTRPDLADRALFLTLRPMAEAQRRPEQELWRAFELARPRLLGTLLDAMSHGLAALPGVHLDRLPRMADFVLWAAACEGALWPAGAFVRAYEDNRRVAIEDAIDADPVAACVRELMAERGSWAGSATDLLRMSANRGSGRIAIDLSGWPKSPRAIAGRLRRAQTFLRILGIEIRFSRIGHSGSRLITIQATTRETVSTVSTGRMGAVETDEGLRYQSSRSNGGNLNPATIGMPTGGTTPPG